MSQQHLQMVGRELVNWLDGLREGFFTESLTLERK